MRANERKKRHKSNTAKLDRQSHTHVRTHTRTKAWDQPAVLVSSARAGNTTPIDEPVIESD